MNPSACNGAVWPPRATALSAAPGCSRTAKRPARSRPVPQLSRRPRRYGWHHERHPAPAVVESFVCPALITQSWRTTSVSRRPPRCSIRRASWRGAATPSVEIGFEGTSSKEWEAGDGQTPRVPGSAPRWPGRVECSSASVRGAGRPARSRGPPGLADDAADAERRRWPTRGSARWRAIDALRCCAHSSPSTVSCWICCNCADYGVGTRRCDAPAGACRRQRDADPARAQSDLAVFENRLDVLSGRCLMAGHGCRSTKRRLCGAVAATGVPAELLLRHSRTCAARAELVAADAEIAAAIADQLPRRHARGFR